MSSLTRDPSAAFSPVSMTPVPPFLPFAKPDIGEAEIAAVVECLRSGWLTTGPRTKEFERLFAELMRPNGQALAVNSATAGLHLALEALGVSSGDEVIVPDYTFTASAEVVHYLGAIPVFVDVDARTLNVTVEGLEAAITPRTKVIMPVHFSGLACDMEGILAMARRHGLAVVDDAAHALPSTRNGCLVGSFDADATVFSFYANKTLSTGEGGMVVTGRSDVATRCGIMRLHGISRDAFARYTSSSPAWHYEVVAPGFKYNLTDIASALGSVQLGRVHEMAERRRVIAEAYMEGFADVPLELPARPASGDLHSWHLFVVRLTDDAPLARDAFIDQMYASGIGCSVHFIPLHRHPYWRDTYGLAPEMFPNAERAYRSAVSLPIYSGMTQEDVDRTIATVRRLLSA
ncbi:MAG: UDP-4-amino-4,6-dideoxy-N-acetyl-beta-L-altrosamine transaminase [Gemmatimonadetes bacterium]|nr:UDP-4-amino-4,6-dideoxy-N-acetyl-beta-L-altrosamine transaminase [Gemmatimonadota bacterium]